MYQIAKTLCFANLKHEMGGLIMSDYHQQQHFDGFGFAIVLVLFILLVIVGAVFCHRAGYGGDYC